MECLITPAQLCQRFHVERRSLTNWINQGMPVERLGRALRFNPDACLAWHRTQQEIKARTHGLKEKKGGSHGLPQEMQALQTEMRRYDVDHPTKSQERSPEEDFTSRYVHERERAK